MGKGSYYKKKRKALAMAGVMKNRVFCQFLQNLPGTVRLTNGMTRKGIDTQPGLLETIGHGLLQTFGIS